MSSTETDPTSDTALAAATASPDAPAEAAHAPAAGPGGLPRTVRVAIIGAGFGGVDSAIQLLASGERDFVVLERADQVAGCWHANTYPGVACDVPSNLYSYSFEPNPDWSRTYSPGGEIAEYIQRTAEKYDVLPHVRFGVSVNRARWIETDQQWELDTTAGTIRAQFVINATGPLTEPSFPDLPGRESFEGVQMHSARWDHSVDLAGKRIAVIGTGASAVQFIPELQKIAGRIDLYQRTAAWVVPRADRATTAFERRLFRTLPPVQQAVRNAVYGVCEILVANMRGNRLMRSALQTIGRTHLRRQVRNPELRRQLTPHFEFGCKRMLISNTWYPAITQPNVELVTDGITEIRPGGVVTADGTFREVDAIVYGTGFHVTDAPLAGLIEGRGGQTLADHWQRSPKAYLGTVVDDFPNLFTLVGPNSGVGHTSIVLIIEWQVKYVMQAIALARRDQLSSLNLRKDVLDRWVEEIDRLSEGTVWTSGGCSSYYIDVTGRNSSTWPTYTWKLRDRLARFDAASYELERAAVPAAA